VAGKECLVSEKKITAIQKNKITKKCWNFECKNDAKKCIACLRKLMSSTLLI